MINWYAAIIIPHAEPEIKWPPFRKLSFRCIIFQQIFRISIQISQKFASRDSVDN